MGLPYRYGVSNNPKGRPVKLHGRFRRISLALSLSAYKTLTRQAIKQGRSPTDLARAIISKGLQK